MLAKTETRDVQKTVTETEKVYVLELSKEEAAILAEIAGTVGGSNKTVRKFVDPLYNRLYDFGLVNLGFKRKYVEGHLKTIGN
ncbi:hypothetical protein [Herbidospora cretacea]|uniref:hypothetical protein n=1 Tax=Herbidospora cretacea TaxID=28444 RepID=UPI000774D45F|nr:hypothetical protein [Herbidospora cretacea]